jgi:hypothetical protein
MKSERIQAGDMIKVTQIELLAFPSLATATSVANTTDL